VTRLLEERGLAAQARPSPWISLEEAAGAFGYSVSRFYHVYRTLGLAPSRASKRKLRFHRQEIEDVLRRRQRVGRGRPRLGRKTGN
jgi:predicted DNA-binding transcriptional regulator AlpA